MKPLQGLRVLELTSAWAGPLAGRFFAIMGAEVVKVESARNWDFWRGPPSLTLRGLPWSYADNDPGERPYNRVANFNAMNRGKCAICLDLSREPGRNAFLRLVAVADAVVCNLGARVLPNLHLDYDDLAAVNPSIILLNMPAMGASGPYMNAAGFGTIIEAMAGMAERFGYPEEGARVSRTYYPDPVAGIHGALALAAAVNQRKRTGKGCKIDLSQQEMIWMQLGEGLVLRSIENREPERLGNAEPGAALSGVFPTRDGRWLSIVVRPGEMPKLTNALAANGAVIDAHSFSSWTAARDLEDALAALRAAGIRCAPVNAYRQAAQSPELLAVDAFERVDHPEAGAQTYLRPPLRIDGQPLVSRSGAPCFGQHTDAVLQSWAAVEANDISSLREQGIITDAPTDS